MKPAGAVLVIIATSAWGITAAQKFQNQYEQLKYLQKIICLLRSEIRYARSYLGEAFSQIGRKAESPYKEWLLELCVRMEDRNGAVFEEIWEAGVLRYLKDAGLPKNTFGRLAAFGSQLGIADVEMQVKLLDLFREEIEQTMNEVQEEMRMKIRLCHCLGVMSGIFITILLV